MLLRNCDWKQIGNAYGGTPSTQVCNKISTIDYIGNAVVQSDGRIVSGQVYLGAAQSLCRPALITMADNPLQYNRSDDDTVIMTTALFDRAELRVKSYYVRYILQQPNVPKPGVVDGGLGTAKPPPPLTERDDVVYSGIPDTGG